MIEYYTGTEQECLDIDAAITVNCGWPLGGTNNWDNPRETTVAGVYAISVPQGSHGFTKDQMTSGISSEVKTDVEFPVEEEDI